MADQATVNGGGRVSIDSPLMEGVIGNLAEFASDCATLAELQAKLAVMDARESARAATIPVAGVVLGGVLALASLPVLLIAAGELIAENTSLERGVAYLIVGGLALVLGLILAAILGSRVGSAFESFRRSSEELSRNVAWVKTVLSHSGRPPVHRRRVSSS